MTAYITELLKRFGKTGLLERMVILMFVVASVIYGGTKSTNGVPPKMNAPRRAAMNHAPETLPSVRELSPDDYAVGFALARIGTNEIWEEGRIVFRYDLSRAADDVLTNLVTGISNYRVKRICGCKPNRRQDKSHSRWEGDHGAFPGEHGRFVDDSGSRTGSLEIHHVQFCRADGRRVIGNTDSNGICRLQGRTSHTLEIEISKEGYYGVMENFNMYDKKVQHEIKWGKWQPWGMEKAIVLPKIRNPVAIRPKNYGYRFVGQCHQ